MMPADPLPPLFAPPPTDSSRRSCLIVGAAVGGLLILLLGLGIFGIYTLGKVASKDPEPFTGYRKVKRIKPASLGWSVYSFPDFRYRVALPTLPTAQPISEWSTEDRLSIKGWATYTLDIKNAGMEMDGYEYRFKQVLSDVAEYQASWYRQDKDNKRLRTKTAEAKIAGRNGLVLTLTYVQENDPAITKVYYFQDRGRMLTLHFHYWEDSKGPAEKDIKRIISSIEFE